MKSTKTQKPTKSKTQNVPVKDLRPSKDAKGGAQKKEGDQPDTNRLTVN